MFSILVSLSRLLSLNATIKNLEHRSIQNGDSFLIPRLFHSIKIGFESPAETCRYQQHKKYLKNFHPGWKLIEWKEKDVLDLIKARFPSFKQTFEAYRFPQQKNNVARYLILFENGGVIFDNDVLSLKNIEPLLKSKMIFLTAGNKKGIEVSNSFIAAVKRHGFFDFVIKELKNNNHEKASISESTGSIFLSKVLSDFSKRSIDENIGVIPSSLINDFYSTEQLAKMKDSNSTLNEKYLIHVYS